MTIDDKARTGVQNQRKRDDIISEQTQKRYTMERQRERARERGDREYKYNEKKGGLLHVMRERETDAKMSRRKKLTCCM